MGEQFLLQRPARLDIERAIDGLVGHLTARIIGIGAFEPAGHLLRRPLPLDLLCHASGQGSMQRRLTDLGAPRSVSKARRQVQLTQELVSGANPRTQPNHEKNNPFPIIRRLRMQPYHEANSLVSHHSITDHD